MAVGVDPVVQYAYTLNNTSESDHALIPISRTEKYFFSCYAKGSASSEFSISVRQYNSSGTYLSTLELLVDGPLTSSYVKKSYQFGNGVTGLGFNSSCTQIQLELYEGANETNVDDVRISREMTADSITAGTLQGEFVNARKLSLDDYAEADYFNYRSLRVYAYETHSDFGKYFVRYVSDWTSGSGNYYALILNGARGGESAGMVRMETPSLDYPIGMIITPGLRGGHQVYIEGANSTFYYKRSVGVSSTTLESYATNSTYNSNTLSLGFGTTSSDFSLGKYNFGGDADDLTGATSNNLDGDAF